MRTPLLLTLILASAAMADPPAPQPAVSPAPTNLQFEQNVLFEAAQEGFAWGYRHQGVIVTVDREVLRFDGTKKPPSDPDAFQLDTGKYGTTEHAGTVPATALAAARALVAGAAEAGDLAREAWAEDAAQRRALAFTGKHQQRRQVHLGTYDVSNDRVTNPAPEAKRLRDWLKKIAVEVRDDPTPQARGGAGP